MKLQELREKNVEELKATIAEYKKQLFDLRLQNATHKLEKTADIQKAKKIIAQAKTVITEKEEAANA